jgi:hypothetical protein
MSSNPVHIIYVHFFLNVILRVPHWDCPPYKQNTWQLRLVVLTKTNQQRDVYRVEPGYNNIGLYDTSSVTSDVLLYQLIPHS